jgi:hypothetical protein
MRTVAAWGLTAAMAVGLGAAFAIAADDTSAKSSAWGPTWQWNPLASVFGPRNDKKAAEEKPVPKSEPAAAKNPSSPTKPASIVKEVGVERSREEAVLLRRLQACDKLKEIAIRTNDKDLLRRAEELEERAQTTYAQRTAHLAGGSGGFESDEKTLDRYLESRKSRAEEVSVHSVSGYDRTSQAAVKEVKP